jgi:hypothetical protein
VPKGESTSLKEGKYTLKNSQIVQLLYTLKTDTSIAPFVKVKITAVLARIYVLLISEWLQYAVK